MITKLLDSQSLSRVWKSSVRQRFCASVDRVTLSADRLGNTSFSLIRRISLQTLRKIYFGYYPELLIKTFDNVKFGGNCMKCFSPPCFPRLQKSRSKQYDFQSIEASALEAIKSRKLQHFALINMKYSTESKAQTGLNRTTTPWQNTRVPRILCLGDEITIQGSPWVVSTAFRLPAPPPSI